MRIPNASILVATVCLVTVVDSQKRAPSGFTGVRGKKSETYDGHRSFEDDPSEHQVVDAAGDLVAEKRAPSGFMGVRGKKPSEELEWNGVQDYGNKRAPSGFLGMRGKKDLDFDEFEKRAPSGFMGMRGKKEFDPRLEYTQYPANDPFSQAKRGPSGFMGMRGKKDRGSSPEEEKRAPNSGFFGMRGKKQPGRSSFFGMRGKKYPYEFRGKFVGVRGKKTAETPLEYYFDGGEGYEADSVANDVPNLNQLMLLLTQNDGYNPDRETAFIGQDYSLN